VSETDQAAPGQNVAFSSQPLEQSHPALGDNGPVSEEKLSAGEIQSAPPAPLEDDTRLSEAAPMAPPPAERVIEQPQETVTAPATATVLNIPAIPGALEPIELPSGLAQVETDPNKLNHAAGDAEPLMPPRPPRMRTLPVSPANEPLEQIETRK
jgi:hypothetical protein